MLCLVCLNCVLQMTSIFSRMPKDSARTAPDRNCQATSHVSKYCTCNEKWKSNIIKCCHESYQSNITKCPCHDIKWNHMKCDDSDWVERACPQAAPAEATANVISILTTSASRPAICQTNICHLCLHCWRTPFPKKSLSQYGCFANPVPLFFCVGVWLFAVSHGTWPESEDPVFVGFLILIFRPAVHVSGRFNQRLSPRLAR